MLTHLQGRPFAWQEILLAIASIVQKFDLSLVDPSYTLELKQALTIKPKGLMIRATLRTTPCRLSAAPSSSLKVEDIKAHLPASHQHAGAADGTTPLYILYGSNTGTSEAFAQRIASDAPIYGLSFFKKPSPAISNWIFRIPSISCYLGLGVRECTKGWACGHCDSVI